MTGPSSRRLSSSRRAIAMVLLIVSCPIAAVPGQQAGPETGEEKSALDQISQRFRFDGELRFRYELRDPNAYTASDKTAADDFVLMRTRLGFTFDLHRRIGAYIQVQDSRIWGEEENPVFKSEDTLDLNQGYMDLRELFSEAMGNNDLSIRLGRQVLSFGDQRLVSPLDWSNVSRRWDAARLIFTGGESIEGLQIDVFTSIIKDTTAARNGFPSGAPGLDNKQEFHGIYSSYAFSPGASGEGSAAGPWTKHAWDLYGFYRVIGDDTIVNEDGDDGHAREFTLGTRLKGGIRSVDYSGEIVYQTGRWAKDRIVAWAAVVAAGYTLPPSLLEDLKVRLGVEFDYGSGDSDPDDGKKETFDPLFPFGHAYQGMQDIFSWRNGQDLVFKITTTTPPFTFLDMEFNPVWFEFQQHFFWLAEREDGWFNAGKGQIRRDPTGSSSKFVGSELDFHFKYTIVEIGQGVSGPQRLWLWAGYSHFFPGSFVRNTGSSPDRDFAYAQMELEF